MKSDTIFKLLILFLFISIIGFIMIGMVGTMQEPSNQTSPEMHKDYVETQGWLKPIMLGLNGVQIAGLAILILAGTGLFVGVLRKWIHGS
jgi:hypothetical protein